MTLWLAVCSCGQGITGDDRDMVAESTRKHLGSAAGMPGTVNPDQPLPHVAHMGEATHRVAVTVTLEPVSNG